MGRHHPDPDPDDASGSGWGMRWEPVPDGDDGDDGDGAGADARRVRLLVAACVVGGLVIVVLTVFGVRALVADLDARSERSKADTIRSQYEQRYRSCVDSGTARTACAQRAATACVGDARWDDGDRDDLLRVCEFGTRAG